MRWFYDMKIGKKLLLGFAMVAVIAAVVGWVGLSGMLQVNALLDTMYADRLIPIRDLSFASTALQAIRIDVLTLFVKKDQDERERLAADITQQEKKIEALIDAYSKTVLVKAEEEALPKFRSAYQEYGRLRGRVVALALKGDDQAALKLASGEAGSSLADASQHLQTLR